MTTWTVTLRTGHNTWSTISIDADDHGTAVAHAQCLLGGTLVKVV